MSMKFNKPVKRRKQLSLSVRHLWEFVDLHPMLREIVGYTLDAIPSVKPWFSSINRSKEENKAAGAKTMMHVVGPPYRACDVGWLGMTQDEVDVVCNKVNARYQYDPRRPHKKVAYGAPHGTGLHIHNQVHPRTIRLNNNDN